MDDVVGEIRHRIYLETNLTASAGWHFFKEKVFLWNFFEYFLLGIGSNLRLAKLCSDINKPNGQFRIENDLNAILEFINPLPIRKINGIGPSSALLLNCYGIDTVKDIYEKRALLYLLESENFFEFLMHVCRGLGTNKIVNEYDKKSLGHEM